MYFLWTWWNVYRLNKICFAFNSVFLYWIGISISLKDHLSRRYLKAISVHSNCAPFLLVFLTYICLWNFFRWTWTMTIKILNMSILVAQFGSTDTVYYNPLSINSWLFSTKWIQLRFWNYQLTLHFYGWSIHSL